jgi:hypothetical protein
MAVGRSLEMEGSGISRVGESALEFVDWRVGCSSQGARDAGLHVQRIFCLWLRERARLNELDCQFDSGSPGATDT